MRVLSCASVEVNLVAVLVHAGDLPRPVWLSLNDRVPVQVLSPLAHCVMYLRSQQNSMWARSKCETLAARVKHQERQSVSSLVSSSSLSLSLLAKHTHTRFLCSTSHYHCCCVYIFYFVLIRYLLLNLQLTKRKVYVLSAVYVWVYV